MKKITLAIIFLFVVCFFVGCSSIKEETLKKQAIEEIKQTLDQEDTQVIIALGDNFEAKQSLIRSSNLTYSGLIALCIKPEPMNINNDTVRSWYREAIERTELTAEQEVQIVKIGEGAYSKPLLLKSNLTAEGLVAICENPGSLNVKNNTVRGWYRQAIERIELTAEQEVQIAKIGEYAYTQPLLLKSNLTAEGLVTICENPGSLNLKSHTVQGWFKEAIKRTELTTEQKNKIAKSKTGGIGLY